MEDPPGALCGPGPGPGSPWVGPRPPSPSARPAVLQGVAEEVPVLIHPHRHRQLVVVQIGQELLFYGIEEPEDARGQSGDHVAEGEGDEMVVRWERGDGGGGGGGDK